MNTQSFQKFLQGFLRQLIPNLGSILVMAAMLFAYNARAAGLNAGASPSTISYQGTLTTASGTPVNTSVGLTFRLYNIQSGGTPLWTEAHTGANNVPVNKGLFNVLLGSVTPIPSSVWSNSTVYLGVQVEGDSAELSPREMVSAVPMAMMTANITIPDNSVTTAKIADGAVTSQKVSPTYWYLADQINSSWSTTISNQYVEVPGFEFTLTPETNGVVFAELNLGLNHTMGNTILNCAIFVNNIDVASARGSTILPSTPNEETCVTSLVYPVVAGQTYRFFATIYSHTAGTMTVHKKSFSHLSGIFWGQP